MVNLSPQWGLGGVLTLGTGSSEALAGLRGRLRRWLGPDLSVELEGGIVVADLEGRYVGAPLWGSTVGGRLNLGDHGSVFLRWDGVDTPSTTGPGESFDEGGFQQSVSAGAAVGQTWAVVGTAALGVLLVAFLASFNTS